MTDVSFLETHFEVCGFIADQLMMHDAREATRNKVIETECNDGRGGLYTLAENWTKEFEAKHKETQWGVDAEFYDTLESFLEDKNKI